MHIEVKICGVTSGSIVDAVVAAGADRIGFVLAPSPRRISPQRATELAREVPPGVTTVAVLRNPTARDITLASEAAGIELIQAEPNEAAAMAIRSGSLAARRLLLVVHDGDEILERIAALRRSGILLAGGEIHLEAPGRGGRGVKPDWERAAGLARLVRLTLAGGLTPHNVEEAVLKVRPAAVDVSSGVESAPGEKDPDLIHAFVTAVRRAERELEELQ